MASKSLYELLTSLLRTTNIGEVKMYAGSTAPKGWLICDGASISRTKYAKLFSVIGTAYGSGDGSTTFSIPDMRGRTAIGVGTGNATGATAHNLATKGGNEDLIVPYHNHSVSASTGAITGGSHAHDIYYRTKTNIGSGTAGWWVLGSATTHTGSSSNTITSKTHSHDLPAHNTNYAGSSGNTTGANMQPYLTLNYIIFAGV